MKRIFALLLLLLLFRCACAEAGSGTLIAVASDLHYLSPRLAQDRSTLMRIVRASDGKVTQYTPQIAAAFVDEMLRLRPDCVILSGDLTLNGARESHEELTALLSPLPAAGIPVLVIPGNHDCTGTAYAFTTEGARAVAGMDAAGFREAYDAFGPKDALARDAGSFSYVYALADDLRILLLDANTAEAPNRVKAETLAWAKEQLRQARQAGARVIGVTHQNLLTHFTGFTVGYRIDNADLLDALFRQYGVRLNLSGHMHLQHIGKTADYTEIATSALSVWPQHYGVITVDGDTASYEARSLDVAAWAKNNGVSQDDLLDFDAYSRAFFDETSRDKLRTQVSGLPIGEEEKERMLEYAVRFNRCVFSGSVSELTDHSPVSLWEEHLPDAFFTVYMRQLLQSAKGDMLRADIPLK